MLELLAVQGLKEQGMDRNLFKERLSLGAALLARPSSETENSWELYDCRPLNSPLREESEGIPPPSVPGPLQSMCTCAEEEQERRC